MDFTVEVNVISFTFYGKDQPGTGKYDLLLRIYDAEGKTKVTYDVANVVELVPHSWLETDEGSVDIESELAMNGEINVIETIKVNGVALEVTDKAVDITVPTELADLQDDATHRLVTDEEKAAWDDKQEAIDDLDDIRAGAAAGGTALQSETDPTVPSWAKQPNKPSYNYNEIGNTPDLSQFITKSVDDLVNYYLKSETYTKAEVQALVNAVKQFTYESVASLPTASADTMHKIYLVPSADPQTQNVKDEYITIDYGPAPRPYALPRYDWEQIGSTAIDLSGYVTTTALNAALAAYTTTADLTTLLAGKQDKIDAQHKLDYSLIENTPAIPTVPAISNDIATDATSTTKTASPKAVKDYVDAQAEIYWATYGTTTFNDLVAADAAGKICMLELNGKIYILRNIETAQAYFVGFYYDYNQLKLIYLSVRNTNQWLASSSDIVELRSNMKTNLSSVDNSSYPSTQAVKNSLDAKQDVIDSSHKLDYSLIDNTPSIPTVPAISNDITTDATSTTKTTSPKAVKDYVDANAGSSLPSGGAAGQVLAKASAADDDVEWVNIPSSGTGSLPAGGTKGMTLVKQSSVDSDAAWVLQDENKQLIIDQTFTLDRLQPTSYDSATGYYTVDSFPSWVTAGNGDTFVGALNVVKFTAANAVPYPASNAENGIELTKVDSTHFSIKSTEAPAGTPDVNAFYFTPVTALLQVPLVKNATTRYRMIVERAGQIPSRYNCFTINANNNPRYHQGYVQPTGCDAYPYEDMRALQGYIEAEFSIEVSSSEAKITVHKIKGSGLGKSSTTAFDTRVRPCAYGDQTVSLWGWNSSSDYFYIKAYQDLRPLILDGTRIRIYILL